MCSVFLEEISCVVLKTTSPTPARGLLLLVQEKRIASLTGGGRRHGSDHIHGHEPDHHEGLRSRHEPDHHEGRREPDNHEGHGPDHRQHRRGFTLAVPVGFEGGADFVQRSLLGRRGKKQRLWPKVAVRENNS
jgi:hypothetical protein